MKGFTLIEILAVIVILAIILLISVPMINGIIGAVKRSAFETSVGMIVRSAELDIMSPNSSYANGATVTYVDGAAVGTDLPYSGDRPQSGTININTKGEVELALYDGEYCATKSYTSKKISVTKTLQAECSLAGQPVFIKMENAGNYSLLLSATGELYFEYIEGIESNISIEVGDVIEPPIDDGGGMVGFTPDEGITPMSFVEPANQLEKNVIAYYLKYNFAYYKSVLRTEAEKNKFIADVAFIHQNQATWEGDFYGDEYYAIRDYVDQSQANIDTLMADSSFASYFNNFKNAYISILDFTPTSSVIKKSDYTDVKDFEIITSSYGETLFIMKNNGDVLSLGSDNGIDSDDNGSCDSISKFTKIPNITNIVKIVNDYSAVYMITDSGAVYSYGPSAWTSIGHGEDQNTICKPTLIEELTNIKEIYAANSRAFAINNDGDVYRWGYMANPKGYSSAAYRVIIEEPEQFTELTNVKEIGYMGSTTEFYVLKNDGSVMSFSKNPNYLITSPISSIFLYNNYGSITNIDNLYSYYYGVLLYSKTGTSYAKGYNYNGLFGSSVSVETLTSTFTPVTIPDFDNILIDGSEIVLTNSADEVYYSGINNKPFNLTSTYVSPELEGYILGLTKVNNTNFSQYSLMYSPSSSCVGNSYSSLKNSSQVERYGYIYCGIIN